MKHIVSTFLLVAAFCTASFASQGDPCGIFGIGAHKVDLSKGELAASITSHDALIDAIQAGFSFKGSADCAGTWQIVNMELRIATAKEDVNYDYDFSMIQQMPDMEDFMLTRYFIDAQTLYFTKITVRNGAGQTMQVPDVQFRLK